MAEVLATLSTIASLIEAGSKIVVVTTKIAKSIRNATGEVKAAHEELKITISVLGQFRASLSQIRDSGDEIDLLQDNFIETINKSNSECTQVFDELKATLQKAMPGAFEPDGNVAGQARKWDQFRWPLTKTEVEKIQVRLQKVQEDMKGHVGLVDLAITTYRYNQDKKWAKEEAKYKYNLIKSQIREAGLRAKHAKLNMQRLQTGRGVPSGGPRRQDTMQSNDDGSVISTFLANLDKPPATRPSASTPSAPISASGPTRSDVVGPTPAINVSVAIDESDEEPPVLAESPTQLPNGLHNVSSQLDAAAHDNTHDLLAESPAVNVQVDQTNVHSKPKRPEPVSAVSVEEERSADEPRLNVADGASQSPVVPVPTSNGPRRPDAKPTSSVASAPPPVRSGAPSLTSPSHIRFEIDANMQSAVPSPATAKKSHTSWWAGLVRQRNRVVPSTIDPGIHYALLLTRASSEWQAYTLRISDEEVVSIVHAFQLKRKMIWQYYSRISPEQINMIEEACEQACDRMNNGGPCTWTFAAIELIPKRSRGDDIRSIKLVIRFRCGDADFGLTNNQDPRPGQTSRNHASRRTRDWAADQAGRRHDRLDERSSMIDNNQPRRSQANFRSFAGVGSSRPNRFDSAHMRFPVPRNTSIGPGGRAVSRSRSRDGAEVRRVAIPPLPPILLDDANFSPKLPRTKLNFASKQKPDQLSEVKPPELFSADVPNHLLPKLTGPLFGEKHKGPTPVPLPISTSKARVEIVKPIRPSKESFSKAEVDEMIAEAVSAREQQPPVSTLRTFVMKRPKKAKRRVGFLSSDMEIVRRPAPGPQPMMPAYFPGSFPTGIQPIPQYSMYPPMQPPYDYYRPDPYMGSYGQPIIGSPYANPPPSVMLKDYGQAVHFSDVAHEETIAAESSSDEDETTEKRLRSLEKLVLFNEKQKHDSQDQAKESEDETEIADKDDLDDADNSSRNSDAMSRTTMQSAKESVVGDLIRTRLNIAVPSDFGADSD